MTNPMTQCAIAGIGQTEFSTNSGRSELRVACDAILAALADAGLSAKDIDGIVTYTIDNNDEVSLNRALGIENVKYSVRLPLGGGGSAATIHHACAAIASGAASTVVIWRAMNERSEYRFGQPKEAPSGSRINDMTFTIWGIPYGLQFPGACSALGFQRYMYKYGVTNEDLGYLVVQQRAYAASNPNARFYGKPITLEDHQNSKWIAEPVLRLFDCCQETDGGVALIVTSRERARYLKGEHVRILGSAFSMPGNVEPLTSYYTEDPIIMREAEIVAGRLYQAAGVGPKDIDVALLYDAFTPEVVRQLEAFRFCGAGEALDFVKSGACAIDGELPLNTNGGLIGEAYIHGLNMVTEGVRQLRGQAANQREGAELVMFSSGNGAIILAKD
ncbi:MAG: lipid-transfer protein [Alphaproteobacteria bacterium]|nr:lipid-transfer protein [Alphaproteobacteria bacterium]